MIEIPVERPKLFIPSEDFVFRNVHIMQHKQWEDMRIPNEATFSLRPGEENLSFTWERYCDLINAFVLLGMQKIKDKEVYRHPKDFKILRLNVGLIRSIKLQNSELVDILHRPELGNYAHCELCCEDEDEIRLKLCDLVAQTDNCIHSPNMQEIDPILQQQRKT